MDEAETKRIKKFKEQLEVIKKLKDIYGQILEEYKQQMAGIKELEQEKARYAKELLEITKSNGESMVMLANALAQYLQQNINQGK